MDFRTIHTSPEGTRMNTLTSDTTAAEASFLLGWALYEILDREHPDRVRFPQDYGDWLTAPGQTMFVPVGDGTPLSQFVGSLPPTVSAELNRQLADGAPSKDWFIELDYWEHAMSGDSEHRNRYPVRCCGAGAQLTQASSAKITAFPHTQHRMTSPSARNATRAASGVERISTASTRIASGPNLTHARTFLYGRE